MKPEEEHKPHAAEGLDQAPDRAGLASDGGFDLAALSSSRIAIDVQRIPGKRITLKEARRIAFESIRLAEQSLHGDRMAHARLFNSIMDEPT